MKKIYASIHTAPPTTADLIKKDTIPPALYTIIRWIMLGMSIVELRPLSSICIEGFLALPHLGVLDFVGERVKRLDWREAIFPLARKVQPLPTGRGYQLSSLLFSSLPSPMLPSSPLPLFSHASFTWSCPGYSPGGSSLVPR